MIDATGAQRTYRWDSPEVASFKYLFNFVLDWDVRDQTVKTLFEEHIGDEQLLLADAVPELGRGTANASGRDAYRRPFSPT